MRILLALFLALCALTSRADETILDFHSAVSVNADASLTVRETIRVRAEGEKIKRGIYRDFPTTYRDKLGRRTVVGFTVLEVLRDGRPEPYHEESQVNGVRVYIGDANVELPEGEYTYTLAYGTTRQLGFFPDHDELYWNVTGNDWDFPIQRASAAVELPSGVPRDAVHVGGYTGFSGAKGQSYRAEVDGEGVARIASTVSLSPGEGLTVVVTWPKGFVREPTEAERRSQFLADNALLFAAGAGLALLLGYYLWVWHLYGRDPKKGVIIPLYEPPGMSPAAVRYLARMGHDNEALACALIDMAVKGWLRIEEDADGDYTVTRLYGAGRQPLSKDESAVMQELLGEAEHLPLKQKHHSRIAAAIKAQRQSLQADYYKSHFATNSLYLIPGLLLSVAVLVGGGIATAEAWPVFLFMTVWLTGWTFGTLVMLKQVVSAWKGAQGFFGTAGALFMSLFALPFVGGEIFGLWMFSKIGSWPAVALLGALAAVNYAFYELLKAPTLAGRKLYDAIEGFRLYLSVAEKDRLNLLNPPDRTPELFEKYLPYALAMGVEQQWAEQFADVLARQGVGGESYSPGWYRGSSWNRLGGAGFATAIGGALGGAISSSSTAPGSSSGSGGGGSSGGGGGGGGGGGW